MISLFRKKTSKKSTHVETAKLDVAPIKVSAPITYEDISLRAYQHWLIRGGLHGYDHEDWFKAEQELAARN